VKTLGLIGGSSWVSTIEYYRLINEGVNGRLGASQYARCIIYSFNLADILALMARQDWDGLLELCAGACEGLQHAGADAFVLCASTLHVVADPLSGRINRPLVHIADATAAAVRQEGLDRVGLLGTRFTMELDFFRERLARQRIDTIIPDDSQRAFIHETISSELGKGIFTAATKSRFVEIIADLGGRGAQGAVLGCTEIPMLVKAGDTELPLFDTTAIHAAAAVNFAVGAPRVAVPT